jgi:hypothetical protein
MSAAPTAERLHASAPSGLARRTQDETKLSFKTTEFWAMVGIIAAILVASAVSDSLGDIRAWTLVAAVSIGYMISRGLAKSGTKYAGEEDPFKQDNRWPPDLIAVAADLPGRVALPRTPTSPSRARTYARGCGSSPLNEPLEGPGRRASRVGGREFGAGNDTCRRR